MRARRPAPLSELAPAPAQTSQPAATTSTTTTAPAPIATAALYNAANYQNFAVVNDGVIFFFDQGVMLPDSAGAVQVLVPRSAIDPMLA